MFAWFFGGGWWWWLFAAVAYRFSTSTFSYEREKNVPYGRPLVLLFGNLARLALGADDQASLYRRLYNGFRGLYQMRTPHLMVYDRVLIKDFACFTDYGMYDPEPEESPLGNGLFNMNDARWKIMRAKQSPVFTSGMLKHMHVQIGECNGQLMHNVADKMPDDGRLELRDLLGRYSTDVIGTCAFRLRLDAISNERLESRKHGKSEFAPSMRILVKELPDASRFFARAFTDTIEYRQRRSIFRNDVM